MIYQFSVFYSQIKSILGIVWENTTPSTEFPRDFCAWIGPLQLGVVFVLNLLNKGNHHKKGNFSQFFFPFWKFSLCQNVIVRGEMAEIFIKKRKKRQRKLETLL